MTLTATFEKGPYLAFHGDAELQAEMHKSCLEHIEQDKVVQGKYNKGEGANFQGCFIGCISNGMRKDQKDFSSTKNVFDAYGFPAPLTKICETIFEGLPEGAHSKFFKNATFAPKLGVDISLVHWKFLHWMVKDTLKKHGNKEVRKGCSKSIAVLKDLSNGVNVTKKRSAAAADAAAAAAYAAADAAAAAAYAARAAAAADAAAYAAYAARAAAAAASDAAAADAYAARAAAARYSRYSEFADKIVDLLGEAK